MLRCEGISTTGRRDAAHLDGVNFTVERGEVLGVLGRAGAGKSTLLRVLAGERIPSVGDVTLDGAPIDRLPARLLVGLATDPPFLPVELTGIEWLTYLATYRADGPTARLGLVRWGSALSGLGAAATRRIRSYASGEVRRLALAGAAVCGHRVVLLDETLTGAETTLGRELRGIVALLAREGRSVIVASRDVTALEPVATRALVLSYGCVAADVRMATLLDERILELTLNGGGLRVVEDLVACFPHAMRTGDGLAIPLRNGESIEQVLSVCRARRIPVAGSRVRYRMLEDILVVAAGQRAGSHTLR